MRIHFIGIGGIGVSALAQYYLTQKWEVSGCDLNSSELIDKLKAMGAKIRIGSPDPACSAGAEKIVYSPAVPKNHPEIQDTRYKIQALSYPEALGELTKTHYTITVSGTHGKSTTTAMLALVLIKAGLNPTVIVGTKLKEFENSNFRMGGNPDTKYKISRYARSRKAGQDTRYLLVEADEHFASFLNYWPKMIVLTNIDKDHLDYYKTLSNIVKTFKKYILHLPKDGFLIFNKDDLNTQKLVQTIKNAVLPNKVHFSMQQKEAKKLRPILKVPGEHIISDALAALAAARALNIPDYISFKALSEYKGAWRRFETFKLKTINYKPYTLVSDYGHNPEKIRVTVEGARSKWPHKKIWLVYQPHQYARTFYLFKDFVKVLSQLQIDKLILADIFDVAGRENEEMRKKVSSKKLFNAIMKSPKKNKKMEAFFIPDAPPFSKIGDYIKQNIKGGEIIIVMGAGNIYALTQNLQQAKIK